MKKFLHVRMDESILDKLDEIAARKGLTRSAVTRIILRDYLTKDCLEEAIKIKETLRRRIEEESVLQ